MLSEAQRRSWESDGFIVLRGFAHPDVGRTMEREVVDAITRDPPAAHPGRAMYITDDGLMIKPETSLTGTDATPDGMVAKVFSTHAAGSARDFALSDAVAEVVAELLEDDIDVFQSQFIFKNPRAWGQPWHQDSFYFPFDKGPQIGVWLAISEATLENGCLAVLPGSHRLDVQTHDPDSREGVNQGYLEVRGLDEDKAVPVLMQPGDVLVFHSHLLHRSYDNKAGGRRSAMVYHYGRAGSQPTRALPPGADKLFRWTPVRRRSQAA